MKERTIIGHINCPTCGGRDAMRITLDKNGDPFGFCDAYCGQQLRVGGDKRRVRDFYERHPQMKPADQAAPATQEKPEPEPEQPPAAPAAQKKAKAEPRSAMADALRMLGAM